MGRTPIRVMGGARIIPIVNPVSWQKKGFAYRGAPSNLDNPTGPQLAAQIALAEAAHAAYGSTGKVGGLPVIAAKVRTATAGKDHGGMSDEERRSTAHEAASGSIAAMRARLAKATR